VLDVFLNAAHVYGVPLRMRGDHGVEEHSAGPFGWWRVEDLEHIFGEVSCYWIPNTPYIVIIKHCLFTEVWHNVRMNASGSMYCPSWTFWAEMFTQLELRHGPRHQTTFIIYGYFITFFLSTINPELLFFADAWNQHRIQIRDGPKPLPSWSFGFWIWWYTVFVEIGSRDLTEEELEVLWGWLDALRDERLLQSQRANNSDREGWSSCRRVGPPMKLEWGFRRASATAFISDEEHSPWFRHPTMVARSQDADIITLCTWACHARSMYGWFVLNIIFWSGARYGWYTSLGIQWIVSCFACFLRWKINFTIM